jgi:O-antigen/teichoic acid export membrane protein
LAAWSLTAGVLTGGLLSCVPGLGTKVGLLPRDDQNFWVLFIVATTALGIFTATVRGIVIGRGQLIVANRIDIGVKGLLLIGYIAFFSYHAPRPFAVVAVGVASVLALALLVATKGPTGVSKGVWSALLAASIPVHGTNILHFINQRADLFFVQAARGSVEVGAYALAASVAQFVLLLSSALALPLLPQISATSDASQAAEAAARVCRIFVATALPASALLACGAPWVLPLVFGRDFSQSFAPLVLLIPGMIGFGLTNILISYFVGINKSRINLYISFFTFLLTLAGNITLTPLFGMNGAALTSTIAYLAAGLLSIFAFHRLAALPLSTVILPSSSDWRAAIDLVAKFRP